MNPITFIKKLLEKHSERQVQKMLDKLDKQKEQENDRNG